MRPAGEATTSTSASYLRERLEDRLSALADALAARNAETLTREVERIRAQAADEVAAQCRELASLSRAVATAEAEREARMRELERELREALDTGREAAPRPLSIPRPRPATGASVTDLWPARD